MVKFNLEDFLRTYKPNVDKIVRHIYRNNKTKLKGYEYINDIGRMPYGGYIRYADLDGNLIGSGIYVKKIKNKIMLKTNVKKWTINPLKYFLFYKKHVTFDEKQNRSFKRIVIDYANRA